MNTSGRWGIVFRCRLKEGPKSLCPEPQRKRPWNHKLGKEAKKMSIQGWANSFPASTIAEKVQNLHQVQVDVNQAQAEARTLRDQKIRQTTVTETPEDEKVRMRRRRQKEQEKKRRRKQRDKTEADLQEEEEAGQPENHKRINVTV